MGQETKDKTPTPTRNHKKEQRQLCMTGRENTCSKSSSEKIEKAVEEISDKLLRGDLDSKIEAAKEIRRILLLIKNNSNSDSNSNSNSSLTATITRTRSKLVVAGVVPPLVAMLSLQYDAQHPALLALLNLAVRNDRNKIEIVTAGAIPPLVELLAFENSSLRELAAAAILTLSAAAPNKPTIAASGAVPLLVQILKSGSVQGKVDAVTALHNLSTCKENTIMFLDASAVAPLILLLKECKKYSKFAEKASALLEILSKSEEGRVAITDFEGGILTLVETVEDGSLVSTEHAVGVLLSLCESCRDKYRELILKEGAIPGLLRLTVDGTYIARERAQTLLDLLRDSPREKELSTSVLEKIACDIAVKVDGADKSAETAKRLLQDMVQRSMELSLSRIQNNAASCAISEIPST